MKVFKLFLVCICGVFGAGVVMAAEAVDSINLKFDKPASIKDWEFEFGGVEHSEKFSDDDADGKKDSGSLEVTMKFPAKDGEHKGAYTFTLPEPIDARRFKSLDFDVKVVEGSAPDSQGDNGYFTVAFRNDGGDWNDQFSDAVRVADKWRHESTPIGTDAKEVKAITFQLWVGLSKILLGR